MHGTIYQISMEPVDLDDYISEDTVSVGDMAGFDYLYDTEKEKRQERIQNLVENVFPKGMFAMAPDGAFGIAILHIIKQLTHNAL